MKKQTIGYVVWRLAMRLRVSMDRALAPLGLTHAQYSLIASLHGLRASEAPTQKQLAALEKKAGSSAGEEEM